MRCGGFVAAESTGAADAACIDAAGPFVVSGVFDFFGFVRVGFAVDFATDPFAAGAFFRVAPDFVSLLRSIMVFARIASSRRPFVPASSRALGRDSRHPSSEDTAPKAARVRRLFRRCPRDLLASESHASRARAVPSLRISRYRA